MSLYEVQKMLREVNRTPEIRELFFSDAQAAAEKFKLTREERDAVVSRDYHSLYHMGVHGLLLRPFSIMNGQSEPDYLRTIRGETK